jgi:hypothetical protein
LGSGRTDFLVNIILLIRRTVKKGFRLFQGFGSLLGLPVMGSFEEEAGGRGGCATRFGARRRLIDSSNAWRTVPRAVAWRTELSMIRWLPREKDIGPFRVSQPTGLSPRAGKPLPCRKLVGFASSTLKAPKEPATSSDTSHKAISDVPCRLNGYCFGRMLGLSRSMSVSERWCFPGLQWD